MSVTVSETLWSPCISRKSYRTVDSFARISKFQLKMVLYIYFMNLLGHCRRVEVPCRECDKVRRAREDRRDHRRRSKGTGSAG